MILDSGRRALESINTKVNTMKYTITTPFHLMRVLWPCLFGSYGIYKNYLSSDLNTLQEHQERTRQVVAGVSQAASQVPDLIGQGGKLLGSVIKAANDTAPLILDVRTICYL